MIANQDTKKTFEGIRRDLVHSGILKHKRVIAKTPLDVRLWLEQNPDNHSAAWADKKKQPIMLMSESYYFVMSSKNSTIFVPPEVHARCYLQPAEWPAIFKWDTKAEHRASKKKPVTLAKSAASEALVDSKDTGV